MDTPPGATVEVAITTTTTATITIVTEIETKPIVSCPAGHALKSFVTSTSSWKCDNCKRKLMIGTEMYGCLTCNWNLCMNCSTKKQSRGSLTKSPKYAVRNRITEDREALMKAIRAFNPDDFDPEQDWYYVDRADETVGPVSRDEFRNAWKNDECDGSTLFWHTSMDQWSTIDTYFEIQEFFESSSVPMELEQPEQPASIQQPDVTSNVIADNGLEEQDMVTGLLAFPVQGRERRTTTVDEALANTAISGQDGSEIMILIEAKGNIEAKDRDGWTAVTRAAANGKLDMLQTLLEAKCNVNTTTYRGETPVMKAAAYGHNVTAKLLLEAKAELHTTDNEGWNALMYAALYGRIEMLKLLLSSGADVKWKNKSNYTALMSASQGGNKAAVKILIEAKGEIHAQTASGTTAMSIAKGCNRDSVVQLLNVVQMLKVTTKYNSRSDSSSTTTATSITNSSTLFTRPRNK